MLKVTLFLVAAATLAGCATTHEERVAALQAELAPLVEHLQRRVPGRESAWARASSCSTKESTPVIG